MFWYLLESPHWIGSDKYPKYMFIFVKALSMLSVYVDV